MKTLSLISCIFLFLFSQLPAVDLDAPGEKKVTVRTEIERGAAAAREALPRGQDNEISIDDFQRAFVAILDQNKQKNTDSDGFLLGAHLAYWAAMVNLCDITTKEGWDRIPPDERLQRQIRGLPRGWLSLDDYYLPLQAKLGIDDKALCNLVRLDYDVYGEKIEARKRTHKEYEEKKRTAKRWTIDGEVVFNDGGNQLRVKGRVTTGQEELPDKIIHLVSYPQSKKLPLGSHVKCLATDFGSVQYQNGEKFQSFLFSPD